MKYSLTLEGTREDIDRAIGLLWAFEKPQPLTQERIVGKPPELAAPYTGTMAERIADDTKHAEIIEAGKAAVAAAPTAEQMEAAVKQYMKDKGIPQARKLLDEYTSGKVSSVPVSQRAELLARLTA